MKPTLRAPDPADDIPIPFTVRLPQSMHRQLRKVAFDAERSRQDIVIEAIRNWLNKATK